ncbi:MAG: helix-turn-helix transcriptional regulator [Rhodospirillales bacterium]|nr:helix-turn-helix transcriptional regulator [Rhodospirillales bacterium]
MPRTALSWGVRDLAREAGVANATVTRFEAGAESVKPKTVDILSSALEDAGVEFIPENGGGPGDRLKSVGP